MGSFLRFAICFLIMLSFGAPGIAQEAEEHVHASPGSEEGLGHAHMEISCSPAVAEKFDRALALLHNFWYRRALEGFQQVSNVDPECAIASWGAAMTYNHPFWDAPSSADETAAWRLGAKGTCGEENVSAREALSQRGRRSVQRCWRRTESRASRQLMRYTFAIIDPLRQTYLRSTCPNYDGGCPNQRWSRLDPKWAFSARSASDAPWKVPTGFGPLRKST